MTSYVHSHLFAKAGDANPETKEEPCRDFPPQSFPDDFR